MHNFLSLIMTENITDYRLHRTPMKDSIFKQNAGDCDDISILSICFDPISDIILKKGQDTLQDEELQWFITTMISCDHCKHHQLNFARYSSTLGWKIIQRLAP